MKDLKNNYFYKCVEHGDVLMSVRRVDLLK